jgi:hypothetical protein
MLLFSISYKLILTQKNKRKPSNIDKFSNISGWVNDLDVYSAEGQDIENRDYSEESNSEVATEKFNNQLNLNAGCLLQEKIWKVAAVREIQEELGLIVKPDRLKPHRSAIEPKGHKFFKIFSLKLIVNNQTNELAMIKKFRPYAGLNENGFTLTQLKEYRDKWKLNTLLQTRLDDIFLPIFQKLISEQ